MDAREKIAAFLRLKGPSLPYAVSKEMELSVTFASAYLAEMSDRGIVRISHIKVGGGSPIYYLPGQESMLQNFANNLGEKHRKAYELLKEKKVLRDIDLEPVLRAAIRDTKDFAVQCEVKQDGTSEIFWKWYLLPDDEAKKLTSQLLGIKEKASAAPAKIERPLEPSVSKPKEEKKEKLNRPLPLSQPIAQQKTLLGQEAQKQQPIEISALESTKQENTKHHASEFYREVLQFFQGKGIRILEENVLRKTEMDFIVDVPSPAGNLRYFVKAKSKKSITDGDLSSLFFQAQSKRLPALFLSKGDLTKKAKEMLEREFHGMKVVKI